MAQNQNEKVACLLTAFQAGDDLAFSTLYDMHVQLLFNYGCRQSTDKELLKDCIHDVFVKLYTKRDCLGSIDNLKSYLLISLKNKLCDELRRRMFISDVAAEDLYTHSSDEDVEQSFLAREKDEMACKQVNHLLGKLSPRQREALTLYYIEEKKYEDICVIMNMNYQSVRNLMHRGVMKLRELAG